MKKAGHDCVEINTDAAGREAADTLQSRAVRAGLQAIVITPTEPGADWLDVWAARDAVAPGTET